MTTGVENGHFLHLQLVRYYSGVPSGPPHQRKGWRAGLEFIGYGFSVGYIRGYIREYNRLFFTR